MKKNLSFLTLFILIISCANPTVVNVIGPNDNKLSCEELSNEIAKANEYADEAKEAKKTGKPHTVSYTHLPLPTIYSV